MQELENEIQNPTGLSTIWTPKLSVDMLLLSRECGIMYSVKNTEGVRQVDCLDRLNRQFIALFNQITYLLQKGDDMYALLLYTIPYIHSIPRRWSCLHHTPCSPHSPFASSGSSTQSFFYFSPFPVDIPHTIYPRFRHIFWTYHVCSSDGWPSFAVPSRTSFPGMHTVFL